MKRMKTQRRGKGSPRYTASSNSVGKIRYSFNYTQKAVKGEVVDILHNIGKSAPLAKVVLETNQAFYVPAGEGFYVGLKINAGAGADLSLGSIMPIGEVKPGTPIYNIESIPGDGGSFFRAGGSFGEVITSDESGVYIKMKSGVKRKIDPKSLCTIGIVSNGGRTIKPFYKAGNKHHAMKAKGGRIYPRVRGYAMNAVDHPHGGSGHNSPGRQKPVSKKFGAPGQKAGFIGAKQTGRKKK
jgi:large subunit ribosomal protein L2